MWNRSQMLLLLWTGAAVSVSLSQYEKITNVPNTCFSIWNKEIPECKRADFKGDGCSPLCYAGLTVIDAEVQAECADVDAGIHTLLGRFLAGEGPSTVCDGGAKTPKTSTVTMTSQTMKAPHQSTDTHTVQQTTATVTQTTAEPASPEATQLTIFVSSSFSSSSSTSTTTSASSTTTAGTTTAQQADRTTSATTSSSSPTSDPDAKGFGGVGDAYDILGGHSSAGQLETPWISLVVAAICAVSLGSAL
ncbi:hypothetical protein PISL3812_00453 [Talaromyces islandicus]|uniref:Extracellular membrane protein CFEM domain-containing protein n=1 Tax=Talaromyces islandicus TaxID=28573 RepID=A0A0U1LJG6_TALIS|nr:hypothetical protein PISL3812_00453 [Talaromyces islandicus]